MKKLKTIVVLTLVFAFILSTVPVKRSEAMNNESAAMLAGAIVLFGRPILNAITRDFMYQPGGGNYYERPTKVIYKKVYIIRERDDNSYYEDCRPPYSAYERGWCDEMRRLERREYRHGRRDARRYYYRYWDP
ncbi:MAG TPA: hypothetical protein ENK09_10470 [Nitrospirae bacterium]|nr:hypothetical protein [Nitrospirota bacterium]